MDHNFLFNKHSLSQIKFQSVKCNGMRRKRNLHYEYTLSVNEITQHIYIYINYYHIQLLNILLCCKSFHQDRWVFLKPYLCYKKIIKCVLLYQMNIPKIPSIVVHKYKKFPISVLRWSMCITFPNNKFPLSRWTKKIKQSTWHTCQRAILRTAKTYYVKRVKYWSWILLLFSFCLIKPVAFVCPFSFRCCLFLKLRSIGSFLLLILTL